MNRDQNPRQPRACIPLDEVELLLRRLNDIWELAHEIMDGSTWGSPSAKANRVRELARAQYYRIDQYAVRARKKVRKGTIGKPERTSRNQEDR